MQKLFGNIRRTFILSLYTPRSHCGCKRDRTTLKIDQLHLNLLQLVFTLDCYSDIHCKNGRFASFYRRKRHKEPFLLICHLVLRLWRNGGRSQKRLVHINRLQFTRQHGIFSRIIEAVFVVNLPQQNAVHALCSQAANRLT